MTRTLQMGMAMLSLTVALVVDVWLMRRAEPHSVAEFSPFTAKLGKEELILSDPMSQEGPLLSHQGGKNEIVDVVFDRGSLSAQTAQLFRQEAWAQSKEIQTISYTTLDSPQTGAAPCRTFVDIHLESPKAAEIRLFQQGSPGGEAHREIALRPAGSRLLVDLQTAPDNPEELNQPGCRKLLQVGPGRIPLLGIPLQILAENNSAVRLKFMPSSSAAIWKGGKKGFFEPFEAINLRASRARVSPIDSPQVLRMVSTTDGRPSINIDDLLIGSDEFRAALSGVGMVTVDGRLVGPTFSEWISASYLRTGVVVFLNLLLACAAVALGRPKRPLRPSERLILPLPPGVPADGLRVFLCHCSEDKLRVRQLYEQLNSDGFQPWLDEREISPATLWDDEIQEALHRSHAIVVCLSEIFVRKAGFVQKELHYALDIALEQPEGAKFLIPVRLEDCEIPSGLRRYQWINLFDAGGYEKLKTTLSQRARQVGIEPKLHAVSTD